MLLAVPVAIEAARSLPRTATAGTAVGEAGGEAGAVGDAGVRGTGTGAGAGAGATGIRRVGIAELARRAAAVLAPPAGAGIYLVWSAVTFGDGLAPLTLQRDAARHGSTSNPLEVLADAAGGTFRGELGTGLHVPWLVLAVAGLVVMARRLPASYTAWCGLVLITILTGSNLDSSERYLFGAFPFLFVAALVTGTRSGTTSGMTSGRGSGMGSGLGSRRLPSPGRRVVWPFVLTCSAAVMTVYASLAFALAYVP